MSIRFWKRPAMKSISQKSIPFGGLTPCCHMYGGISIKVGKPQLRLFKNAIFVPKQPRTSFAEDLQWGLYDAEGKLIDAASYTRGLGRLRVGQSEWTSLKANRLPHAPESAYVYTGPFHFHYGHFLLVTLGRLWPWLDDRFRGLKIAYHGREDPETMLQASFARDITGALGLTPSDFINFVEPTCLREVWVPDPALDEDQSSHRVYGELAAMVGARLIERTIGAAAKRSAPAYLSKSRLSHGVWRFRNEALLDACLQERGIDIIHPESLNLADQIRLFDERDVILSNGGSALHTSVLSQGPTRIIGLSRSPWIHSSQIMIDMLKGNRSIYFDLSGVLDDVGPDGYFGTNFDFVDPEQIADRLIVAVSDICSEIAVPMPGDYAQAAFPG